MLLLEHSDIHLNGIMQHMKDGSLIMICFQMDDTKKYTFLQ